jgi:DNA adenine methylase
VLLDVARRHPALELHANDADPGLVAFWRCVAGKSVERLCERIYCTKPTLKLFRQVLGSKPAKQEDIAFRFYFLNRTSFSGSWRGGPIGGYTQRGRWKVDAEWRPGKSLRDIMEANRLLRGRLRLSCQPGADYVTQNLRQPLYCDPPYFCGDRLYEHKLTFSGHLKLSRLLRKARSWVLTYDDSPVVRQLYSWACIHFVPARYIFEAVRARRAVAHELVVTPH